MVGYLVLAQGLWAQGQVPSVPPLSHFQGISGRTWICFVLPCLANAHPPPSLALEAACFLPIWSWSWCFGLTQSWIGFCRRREDYLGPKVWGNINLVNFHLVFFSIGKSVSNIMALVVSYLNKQSMV
jgi:hypothetical protein